MESKKSLWGNLTQVKSVRTPFVILKEQAEILTEETKGLLVGEVREIRLDGHNASQMTLVIVAPALNHYRYAVVEVTRSPQIYPVTVRSLVVDDFVARCDSEGQFEEVLGDVLSSLPVQKVIEALLSDIQAASDLGI
jgi:hypothetical protein